MKQNFELGKNTAIILIILIFSVSFLFLGFARHSINPDLISGEPYYHLRVAESVEKSGVPKVDSLLESKPEYFINIIDFLPSFFSDKILFMMIIPFLLGLASLLIFYFIISEFKISEKQKFFSCVLLILSPPFIYTFSSYTNYTFIIFFNITFAFLYLKKMRILSFLAVIPAMLISLPSVLMTIVLVFFIGAFSDDERKKSFIFSSIIAATSIILYFTYYFPSFLPNKLIFSFKNILTSVISDLGADVGISIFHAILLVIGVLVIRRKEKRFQYYLSLLIAFALSVYFPLILIFFNFFVCVLASFALFEIYNKNWEILALKNITIILIAYGILFSAFSFQTRLINSNPIKAEADSLIFLKGQPDGAVLSHYSNGYFIEYFSAKEVMLDDRLYTLSAAPDILNDMNTIFYSRNIETTSKLLSKHNISYIFIDNDMKNGLVWDKRNQGLLFLLDHTERFEKIYNKDNIEIWKII